MLTRRTFLAGSAAAGAAAFVPGLAPADNMPVVLTAPPAAYYAGMRRLTLEKGFRDLADVDLQATGAPGYEWYPRAPWGHPTSPAGDFQIVTAEAEPFLRITPTVTNCNWSLSTMDPRTGNGRAFRHAYFEAKLRFEPRDTSNADWAHPCWPSFWGLSKANALNTGTQPRMGELDFFEALGNDTHHVGTLHDATVGGAYYRNRNNATPVNVDFRAWHRFGCLWTPPVNGVARAAWYLDDQFLTEVTWGTGGPTPLPVWLGSNLTYTPPADVFTVMDTEELVVAIGSGTGWPMDVAWVRVWQ